MRYPLTSLCIRRIRVAGTNARWLLITALVLGTWTMAPAQNDGGGRQEDHGGREKILYIWAQDEAHVAPDFLAVIDFMSPDFPPVIDVSIGRDLILRRSSIVRGVNLLRQLFPASFPS